MRLELHTSGWAQPPAYALEARKISIFSEVGQGGFTWDRWDIPSLFLSPQASLLLVQGLKLQKIFDDALLAVDDGPLAGGWTGPYLFAKGNYLPYSVPPKITGVVLARVREVSPSVKIEDVLGAIAQVALATS